MSDTARRVFVAIVIAYLVSLLLILLGSYVMPRPEARGVLRTLFGLLLFPSLILFPLSALLRRGRLALPLAPAVIVWMVVFGMLLLPRSPNAPQGAARFTILTFNVQTATENLDSLAALIRAADADIVALQELSAPAAAFLGEALADLYPEQALHPQEVPNWGQGILTRFPLLANEFWRNEQIEVAQGHMWAQIEIAGQAVTVFSTHPVPPLSFEKGLTLQQHSREIAILLERAAQHDTPQLLVGDFNMTELMDEYQRVTERYVDTFRQAGSGGLGFTFPAGQRLPLPPVIRIDYIFHTDEFQGLNAYPLARSSESDHLPFWAELAFSPEDG
ncbi:MAG: endonuclease/exonuclease/phosphatase family protein [Chloroflexi bacterium]|nr:endonuclease/exonuclease/phosphatase family protein [Chloroflexota bacterium]